MPRRVVVLIALKHHHQPVERSLDSPCLPCILEHGAGALKCRQRRKLHQRAVRTKQVQHRVQQLGCVKEGRRQVGEEQRVGRHGRQRMLLAARRAAVVQNCIEMCQCTLLRLVRAKTCGRCLEIGPHPSMFTQSASLVLLLVLVLLIAHGARPKRCDPREGVPVRRVGSARRV